MSSSSDDGTPTTDATDSSGAASSDSSAASSDSSESSGSSSDTDTGGPVCVVDGAIGDDEQCDDGNDLADDGCSDCLIEDGWGCANEPSVCFRACDPLMPGCDAGEGCYPADPVFVCAPDGSDTSGQQYTECMNINGCDPGLVCVPSDAVSACSNPGGGCCTAVCDLGSPTCPDALSCVPFYPEGMAPEGFDHVGVCVG